MKLATFTMIAAFAAAPALADHPYAKGDEASGGVARAGVTQGTLHPGHVAVIASDKYNKPAADYHLDGEPYQSGPGGYADTKKNENADK